MSTDPITPELVRQVFKGRIFSVAVERITLPHGHRLDAEVIRHPPSVVLVPMDADGHVILIRQVPARGRPVAVGAARRQHGPGRGRTGGSGPRVPGGDRPDSD